MSQIMTVYLSKLKAKQGNYNYGFDLFCIKKNKVVIWA